MIQLAELEESAEQYRLAGIAAHAASEKVERLRAEYSIAEDERKAAIAAMNEAKWRLLTAASPWTARQD